MHSCVRLAGGCGAQVNFYTKKGPVSIEWFLGAKTNLAYNALDRHVLACKGDKVSFYW